MLLPIRRRPRSSVARSTCPHRRAPGARVGASRTRARRSFAVSACGRRGGQPPRACATTGSAGQRPRAADPQQAAQPEGKPRCESGALAPRPIARMLVHRALRLRRACPTGGYASARSEARSSVTPSASSSAFRLAPAGSTTDRGIRAALTTRDGAPARPTTGDAFAPSERVLSSRAPITGPRPCKAHGSGPMDPAPAPEVGAKEKRVQRRSE